MIPMIGAYAAGWRQLVEGAALPRVQVLRVRCDHWPVRSDMYRGSVCAVCGVPVCSDRDRAMLTGCRRSDNG